MANESAQVPAASAGGEREPAFTQGFRCEGDEPAQLEAALEAAFGYRGNVTLFTKDGEEIVGYLANRDSDAEEPFVEMLPVAGGRRKVAYATIRAVHFTGKDTAAGKSWERWVAKHNAKKAAEARGESVESIDLVPEDLD